MRFADLGHSGRDGDGGGPMVAYSRSACDGIGEKRVSLREKKTARKEVVVVVWKLF